MFYPYLVAHPSIKKPEELRGKIAGNHIAGTTAEFALRISLNKLGIDPQKDIQMRVIGGTIERMAALQKGLVQFTVLTQTGKAMAEKSGFPTVVDMIAQGIAFPQNGIYTSGKMIRERPDAVRRYIRSYVDAIHYYKTHKEDTLKILRKFLSSQSPIDQQLLRNVPSLLQEVDCDCAGRWVKRYLSRGMNGEAVRVGKIVKASADRLNPPDVPGSQVALTQSVMVSPCKRTQKLALWSHSPARA